MNTELGGRGDGISSTRVGREGLGGGAGVVVNREVNSEDSWAAKLVLAALSAGLSVGF